MTRRAPLVFALGVLLVYAALTHAYVRVWLSDATLWAHAVDQAPLKPRPLLNYGITLIAAGHARNGLDALHAAARLAEAPHVPSWDRSRTRRDVELNIARLADARKYRSARR